MSPYAGVAQILRFNWPWYAGAVAATVVAGVATTLWIPDHRLRLLVVAAVLLMDAWLVLSLLVSHLIYDRSAVARGGWLPATAADIVILHAGHDEASPHVRRLLPDATVRVFDVFDAERCSSPSLLRARAEAATTAAAAALERIPLPDAAAGLVLVVFAAHEVRDETARLNLFREIARLIGRSGLAVVVEHQRDLWNLLAYGPGFLHFLPRRAWMRTFTQAGLLVVRDDRLTPWVHRFQLKASS